MKSSFIVTAIVAVSTSSVYAYQCSDTASINQSCRSISVFPLVCNNPNLNREECNAKQCNQTYIDNYAVCQCRRYPEQFYEHSANVEGLLRRCGVAGLTNPYGNPFQYRPGQGTATFVPSSTPGDDKGDGSIQMWAGTTYYGGTATVVDGTTRWVGATAVVGGSTLVGGTTTWVSGTPGIIGGTTRSFVGAATPTSAVGSTTAAPIVGPTDSPVPVQEQSSGLSGGAIAGIVIGCLAALAIAGLLAWCWRKKRHQHTAVYNEHSTYDNHGPTRTVVTEKIEPVVVKTGTTNFSTTTTPGATTYSTTTTPVNNYSTGTNYDMHPSTAYNTTTTNTGYNSAYNTGRTAVDGAQNAVNSTYNAGQTATNSAYNAANNTANTVNYGTRSAGNAANNAMH
ncbi:hypothetical protein BG005_003477 [Podila minutissima]|nr:hypothetical protein BG005_003477 [Podila minutissima]